VWSAPALRVSINILFDIRVRYQSVIFFPSGFATHILCVILVSLCVLHAALSNTPGMRGSISYTSMNPQNTGRADVSPRPAPLLSPSGDTVKACRRTQHTEPNPYHLVMQSTASTSIICMIKLKEYAMGRACSTDL
jgi:hypothetical protein